MKSNYLFLLTFMTWVFLGGISFAQNPVETNRNFTGAPAAQTVQKVIFQLDQSDSKIIEKTIRNINNLLNDPRLTGKVEVEVVAFSGGIEALIKGSPYEDDFRKLVEKGVIVAQCENTLKRKNMSKDELFDFIGYVPTGVGELVLRAGEGWTIIKP